MKLTIYCLQGALCAKKWKDLVDTFRRKVDKSGAAGVPLNDKVLQWKFWDRTFVIPKRIHCKSEVSYNLYLNIGHKTTIIQ